MPSISYCSYNIDHLRIEYGVPVLRFDMETRGILDLRKTGAYKYAQHSDTEIMCMAWAIDDGPVDLWWWDTPFPKKMHDHIVSGGLVEAHNAFFERCLYDEMRRRTLGTKSEWPKIRDEQWRCSASVAAYYSLPRSH